MRSTRAGPSVVGRVPSAAGAAPDPEGTAPLSSPPTPSPLSGVSAETSPSPGSRSHTASHESLAALVAPLLGTIFMGYDPGDAVAYGTVAVILVLTGVLAAATRARRAVAADVAQVLRAD